MNPKSTISVTFLPLERIVEASHEESLLEAGLREGLEISHSCGGHGTCGTCRVLIVEGLDQMAPRSEAEEELATDRKFKPNERLCCQNTAVDGLVVEIPGSERKN